MSKHLEGMLELFPFPIDDMTYRTHIGEYTISSIMGLHIYILGPGFGDGELLEEHTDLQEAKERFDLWVRAWKKRI